jgi:hypothetical protein
MLDKIPTRRILYSAKHSLHAAVNFCKLKPKAKKQRTQNILIFELLWLCLQHQPALTSKANCHFQHRSWLILPPVNAQSVSPNPNPSYLNHLPVPQADPMDNKDNTHRPGHHHSDATP